MALIFPMEVSGQNRVTAITANGEQSHGPGRPLAKSNPLQSEILEFPELNTTLEDKRLMVYSRFVSYRSMSGLCQLRTSSPTRSPGRREQESVKAEAPPSVGVCGGQAFRRRLRIPLMNS